jgi:hypothetical protein
MFIPQNVSPIGSPVMQGAAEARQLTAATERPAPAPPFRMNP